MLYITRAKVYRYIHTMNTANAIKSNKAVRIMLPGRYDKEIIPTVSSFISPGDARTCW